MASPEIIMIAQGTLGDIHPILGIARALEKAGYHVTLVTNEHFSPVLEKYSLDFKAIGSEKHYQEGFGKPYSGISHKGFQEAMENTIEPNIICEFKYIEGRLAASETKPVIVAHTTVNGGLFAAEKFDLPFVKLLYAPGWIPSAICPPWPFGEVGSFLERSFSKRIHYPLSRFLEERYSLVQRISNRQRRLLSIERRKYLSDAEQIVDLALAMFPRVVLSKTKRLA